MTSHALPHLTVIWCSEERHLAALQWSHYLDVQCISAEHLILIRQSSIIVSDCLRTRKTCWDGQRSSIRVASKLKRHHLPTEYVFTELKWELGCISHFREKVSCWLEIVSSLVINLRSGAGLTELYVSQMSIRTTTEVTGSLVLCCSLRILRVVRNVMKWHTYRHTIFGWPSPPRGSEEEVQWDHGGFVPLQQVCLQKNWKRNCPRTQWCLRALEFLDPRHRVTACLTRQNFLSDVRLEFSWKGTLITCRSTPKSEGKGWLIE